MTASKFKWTAVALCIAACMHPSLSRAQVAAAGSLTGTTIAPNVVNSSLTSVGTLTGLTVNGPSTLTGTNALSGNTTLSNFINISGITTVSGPTSITGVTDINAGGSTSNTTIGNALNQTFLNGATNSMGVSGATTNFVGNSNALTTTSARAGASYNLLSNTGASMGTGNGGAVQTDSSSATIRASSTGTLASNGTTGVMSTNAGGGYSAFALSQNTGTATIGGVVNNKQFTNKISGNTFIDGNLYINGTLDYVSSNSANTSVIGSSTSTSKLANATQAVSAGTAIVAKGSTGTQTVIDANGKLMNVTGVASESTASLTLTNGVGNTHGLVVTETQASLSGGTNSSTLTMSDNGATFSDAQTGAPVGVHGVADGKADFDAINVRQFAVAVASVTAMANIPQVQQDGTYSLGVGVGTFMGRGALAAGMSYRFTRNGVFKASISSAFSHSDTETYGLGVAWSY